ncbi:MAG: acyltransferase [Hyphomonadaceae bacterium]
MKPAVLNGISSLRAISCLLIAVYHITENLVANGRGEWFPFPQTPGIHLFLVISGFVLAYTARADDTPVRFILRRLARVVPLYWLLTALTIMLASWHSWLFPGADLSFSSIVSSFLFLPQRDLLGAIQPILFVGWTLNYIVLTYIMVAMATVAPARMRPFIAIGLLVAFMTLARLLPEVPMRAFWSDWIQLEFIVGLAAGALMHDSRVAAWIGRHSMWPITAVGGIGLVAGSLSDLGGLPRILVCGLSSAVVVFSLAGQDIYRKALVDGLLPWVGRISYSIYLVHPLIVPLVGLAVIGHLGSHEAEVAVDIVVSLGLTIAAAYVCYRFVESPIYAWVRDRTKTPQREVAFPPA